MEDFIAMTKKQKVTKEPIDPTNLKVTGTPNKENGKTKKSGGIKNIFKGFHQGSKQTNQVTKSPMAPTNLNVTGVIDKEDHGAAQTNQVIEAPVNPIEMGENGTAKKKLGIIKKLKVLISDTKYIPNLTKKLEEINGKSLKDKDGKIDEKIKAELIKKYNIRLESNTLLEVIYKNKEYNYNTTPLLLAVQSNLTEVAQAILSITDANLHIQDNEGMNVLHYAAKNNDELTVKTLLQKKLQVNVEDKKGKTALHYAALNGHIDVIKALIAGGADINVKDKDGNTALHHATENNYYSIVKTLLQHGANINALDKNRKTPLFYALTKNHSILANFMMTKGALLEIKDNNQETSHYNGQNELLADTSLETSDTITTREGADLFDEQSTDTSLENISNATTASESVSLSDGQLTKFDYSHTSFVDIPLPKSTLEENLSDEQPITSEAQIQPTHDETRKHPWLPLRKVPKIKLPSQPNEAKGTYKIVILVASAATIITASMLTYFTTLPTLAIIGIAFASALVFGSIATLKPMSKMDDTDCSHVRNDSKNLFV